MKRFIVFCILLILVDCKNPTPCQAQWKIWSWGNDTIEWSRRFNLYGLRIGCNNPPETCVANGNSEAQSEGVTTYSIGLEPSPAHVPITSIGNFALRFSQLSLSNPMLTEFGLDDFSLKVLAYAYENLRMTPTQVEGLLNDIIDKTKSANPNLKFGVTIYQRELRNRDASYFDDVHLTPSVRGRIDFVHLFIIYRMDGPDFAQDVQRARDLFPNARIIAGSYSYDRIDYKPCSQADDGEDWWINRPQARCTEEQERLYLQESLDVQISLLCRNLLEGVEVFPGFMGNETQIPWGYYDEPPWGMGCLRPWDICVSNTRMMNQITVDTLNPYRIIPRCVT